MQLAINSNNSRLIGKKGQTCYDDKASCRLKPAPLLATLARWNTKTLLET
jgi:hypothetical protein